MLSSIWVATMQGTPLRRQRLTMRRWMIRGMHYQADPKPEIKLVRCIAGAVLDVSDRLSLDLGYDQLLGREDLTQGAVTAGLRFSF